MDRCKPNEFQIAIEEAFLAERGFTEKLIADINMAAGNTIADEFLVRGTQEATGSNQDPDCHSPPKRTSCIRVLLFYILPITVFFIYIYMYKHTIYKQKKWSQTAWSRGRENSINCIR